MDWVDHQESYETRALNRVRASEEFLTPGNSNNQVAQVLAAQAQVYATLALMERDNG